ncbi:hypothetical protein [Thauera sp. 63]|uniref:hypothetical protein n=1 Tax=Thauera sp. 63 TaxID=497321 RepID=UPI0002CF102D|nr:hypothetical protein [Thauera sp. 63]ENO80348.1 hypothetical protein C664_01360 [Thauera sp. 63]
MPQLYRDLVEVYTTTTGTGTLVLGGTVPGRQSLNLAGYANGDLMPYRIVTEDGANWEIGVGTLSKPATTWSLVRSVVLSSSNLNNKVNFPAGTKRVACVIPAQLMCAIGVPTSGFVQPSVAGTGVAAGSDASAGTGGVAYGQGAKAGSLCVALGNGALANTGSESRAIAIGDGAQATKQRAVALGAGAVASEWRAVALPEATASGYYSVACPAGNASGGYSFAMPGAHAEKCAVAAQGGSNFAALEWCGHVVSQGGDYNLQDVTDNRFQLPGSGGTALIEVMVIARNSTTGAYAARITGVVRYSSSAIALVGAPTVTVIHDTTGGAASATLAVDSGLNDLVDVRVNAGTPADWHWTGSLRATVAQAL